jgi:hypothetical protein
MHRSAIHRWSLVVAIAVASLGIIGSAGASSHCLATLTPAMGYPGATVSVSGTGFTAGGDYFFNFTHNDTDQKIPPQVGKIGAQGQVSFSFQIPGDWPTTGTANWILFDDPHTCDAQGAAYPMGPVPTTTTTSTTTTTTTTTTTSTSTTTTTTTTTTTVPETTTTVPETTTTVPGSTTTTVPGSTTTTTVAETTTTTEVEDTTTTTGDPALVAGETTTPGWVWWVILLLVFAFAALGWNLLNQRRTASAPVRPGEPPPPPPAE